MIIQLNRNCIVLIVLGFVYSVLVGKLLISLINICALLKSKHERDTERDPSFESSFKPFELSQKSNHRTTFFLTFSFLLLLLLLLHVNPHIYIYI
ncbi:hypothetical protein L6452_13494 [Arctium lappa]|uniref:Uncharacterized protein n=1 Tax=Arctium lappa TaxID=4217 RepID=A0ACB9CIC3_ARCLA|nr:hypothetical protein L6452_13494 [Arctium lappa]